MDIQRTAGRWLKAVWQGLVAFIAIPITPIVPLFIASFVLAATIPSVSSSGLVAVNGIIFIGIYILIGLCAAISLWQLWERRWYILVSGCCGLVGFAALLYFSADQPHGGIYDESRRTRNLFQIALALNLYYDENRQYPPIPLGCQGIDLLTPYLTPTYITQIPHDPFVYKGYPDHDIGFSSDRNEFVVRAKMRTKHPVLEHDEDGLIFGCDCDDPNYCKKF